ncbi:hypothetical protein I4U23_018722 [Adineta vaga]|nr:hypothetical protein I4U23_018722 [Adineta vaga]
MPEMYSFQSAENRNSYSEEHHSIPTNVENPRNSSNQKIEVYYLEASNEKQILSYNSLKPTSLPTTQQDSNSSWHGPELYHFNIKNTDVEVGTCRASPELISKKRKSSISYKTITEMYYLSTDNRKIPDNDDNDRQLSYRTNDYQQLKSTRYLTPPDSPSEKKVTLYTLTNSNENHFPPNIPHTPSPPLQPFNKKQLVTFATTDKSNMSTAVRYTPSSSSRSKALESIQRSMNKYRFHVN